MVIYVDLANRCVFEESLIVTLGAKGLMEPFSPLSVISNDLLWLAQKINDFRMIHLLKAFGCLDVGIRIEHHLSVGALFGVV